jgi:hypothetical protein
MYKEASKIKLRVQTTHGLLSVEQLWSLSLEELDSIAVRLEEEFKASKKSKSFIRKTSKSDKVAKLKFGIVLDILETKLEERDNAATAADARAEEQKLLAILAKKKDAALEDLTEAEIEKRLAQIQKKK